MSSGVLFDFIRIFSCFANKGTRPLYIPGKSDELWAIQVVGPALKIIRAFLTEDERLAPNLEGPNSASVNLIERDWWTQYICKVGNAFDSGKFTCFSFFSSLSYFSLLLKSVFIRSIY